MSPDWVGKGFPKQALGVTDTPLRGQRARLMVVGDVHLGRSPSGLPEGADRSLFGPRAALAGMVERALDERLDAVLFAGDVVDAERDFFEAYRPLTDAARRLLEAGIEVIAVSGNHDVHVLPRLAKEVSGVRLLGAGGRWETHVVQRSGVPVARILGWSFPRPRVSTSPLRDLDQGLLKGADSDLPTIGLLHGDLDASNSHYAPFARHELEAVDSVDAWLLGHIHAPSDLAGSSFGKSGSRPIGYLGSLSALDPSAPGRRGPWLLRVDADGLGLEHLALSALRFERAELDITEAADQNALEELLARSVREIGERVSADGGEARLIGVRLQLCGRSRLGRATRSLVNEQALGGLGLPGEDGAYLEAIVDQALPFVDLASLAENADPLGLVARRVLALQADDEAGRRLVRRALPALRARAEHASFTTYLGEAEIDGERARQVLLEAGRRTLDELLSQRPDLLEGKELLTPQQRRQVVQADGELFLFEEDEERSTR